MAPRLSQVHHDGLCFEVRDRGPLDGAPLVLLHGFPQRAASWDAVEGRLNAAGLRTFALDQRGYSPDARPAKVRAYTLSHLVGDVVALIERIGGPVHLVGHDWGAGVAWALAANRPDLVITLTAVSVPHPRALLRAMRTIDQIRRSWYLAAFQLPRVPEWMLAGERGERALRASGMDARMVAAYRTGIVQDGALTYALNWYRALRLRSEGLTIGPVTVPTCYLWSSGDTALGPHAAALCRHQVSGDYLFREIPGASHWLVEQHPDEVARAVLDRIGPGHA